MSGRRGRGGGGGGGHGGGGEERWLLPYSDMITLLLGLFIVLFAMSTIDAKQFENVRQSLSQTFHGEVLEEPGSVLPGSQGVLDPDAQFQTPQTPQVVQRLQRASQASAAQFDEEAEKVEKIAKSSLGNDVKVTRNERGITVSLAGDALFDSGSWSLKPKVRGKLAKLEAEMAAFGRDIEIAGHTDGQPYQHAGGNWWLSSQRSLSVVQFFQERGFPRTKMHGTYYADSVPVKAPPKDDPQQPMAENRRIEITILAPGANDPRAKAERIEDVANEHAPKPPKEAAKEPLRPIDPEIQREMVPGVIDELAATSKELQ